MRTFIAFLSSLIVVVLLYTLFFDSVTRKAKKDDHLLKSYTIENASARKVKLSMEQIDSLTAFENYKFTIENYSRDVVPVKI
jgi:hypothetical protein